MALPDFVKFPSGLPSSTKGNSITMPHSPSSP